jgi:septal ring factor EnvC (AmiA/AmiB activator)
VLFIQALLCWPLAAGTVQATDPENQRPSVDNTIRIAALSPSTASGVLPPAGHLDTAGFRKKLAEARAILEDLRTFAGTAQQAIRSGERISSLRLENQRLKQEVTDQADGRQDLERDLVDTQALSSHLTGIVVDNWLTWLKLIDQDEADDRWFVAARADWLETERHLLALREQVKAMRKVTHDLRARRAGLAAEIGRTRRQIINLEDQTRVLEDDRQGLETMARELRHEISARLRTILAAD